jgi:glutamyl-tRNA reductase
MAIIVCGINHKCAPIALREKAIFPVEKLPLYLNDLQTQENIEEAVILSTCNRSEIYCETEDSAKIVAWFARQHQLNPKELETYLYIYQDAQAVAHMMHVACGLDSMILGEVQILGQMKNAFSESCAAGLVGPLFNRLFQQVFTVAKEIRTHTSVGACPVSVASTAVNLAKQVLPSLAQAKILVIGAGATIELVLQHLKAHSAKHFLLINRSQEKAQALAHQYEGDVLPYTELTAALQFADLVITATGSSLPIITKDIMQNVLEARAHRQLTMIDLAVPRDIEASVSELACISLYCIDDLKNIIQHNLQGREHAATKAREVIQNRSADFMAWLDSFAMVATTIKAYRKQIESLCQDELLKAHKQLQRGEQAADVLANFAHAFTNKLLHTPSVQLRQAGLEGRIDILQIAQHLFAIPQTSLELI